MRVVIQRADGLYLKRSAPAPLVSWCRDIYQAEVWVDSAAAKNWATSNEAEGEEGTSKIIQLDAPVEIKPMGEVDVPPPPKHLLGRPAPAMPKQPAKVQAKVKRGRPAKAMPLPELPQLGQATGLDPDPGDQDE